MNIIIKNLKIVNYVINFLSVSGINTFHFILNFTVSIILLWTLSIDQYAIYILASLIVAAFCMVTDPGISHVLVSLISSKDDDYVYTFSLWKTGVTICCMLGLIGALGVPFIANWAGQRLDEPSETITIIVILSATIGILQACSQTSRAVFTAHQMPIGLAGNLLCESVGRILFVTVVMSYPTALTALSMNLLALCFSNLFSVYQIFKRFWENDIRYVFFFQKLIRLIMPLLPGGIYYGVQNQVALFLLADNGNVESLSQVGVVSRILPLFSLLSIITIFFIQPYFSKNRDNPRNIGLISKIIFGIICFVFLLSASSFIFPEVWVWIFGGKYNISSYWIILTIGIGLFLLVGAVFYSINISMENINLQYFGIIPPIISQLIFVVMFDVDNTERALWCTLTPAVFYATFQGYIVLRRLIK